MQLVCNWMWGINIREVNNLTGIVILLIAIYDDSDSVPQAVKERYHYSGAQLPEEVWSGPMPFYRWLSAAWQSYNR